MNEETKSKGPPKRKWEDVVREARASLRASFDRVQALEKKPLPLLALEARANPGKLRMEITESLSGIINAVWLLTEETE